MTHTPPARVGPYRIEGEIGRGGMGVVWLATDTRLDREVAVKALSPALSLSEEEKSRLQREAKLLASLNHPHIATIHGLEEESGSLYLVLELLEGEGLEERLKHGPLPVEEALRVGAQVAEALEAAHDVGIVHRDLKPGNVRFTARGTVKLLDFGIAEMGPGSGVAAAGGNEVLGTPGYMSPEQVRGGWVDRRTDIWSLGCLVYECLVGKPAFDGGTAAEVMGAVREGEPEWDGLPEEAKELLQRCLAKEPRGRPHDAGEVRTALRLALEDSGKRKAIPGRPRHNLPARRTSFVGREKEIGKVREALAKHRLVTLTGVGGSGKTRLALEAVEGLVEEHPDGIWLVELAARTDPSLVPQAVAEVFGLKEQPGRTIDQVLLHYLREKELLLVLDNCEHLLEACAELGDKILARCPGVRMLASSREGLTIAGEVILQVPSLEMPPEEGDAEPERPGEYEAVRLFLDRAQHCQPDFELNRENAVHVTQICRRLDGMPLGIELAAARVPVLSVNEIAGRLDDALRLLTGGSRTALPRQRTLQATIDWSYHLLDENEQALFRRLSVFVGGWTLEAAEEVCSGKGIQPEEVLDLLGRLVRKSLVEVQRGEGERRYRYLETVGQFAEERLTEAGESDSIREQHLEWYRMWAAKLAEGLKGPQQGIVMARLASEHANLASAIAHAADRSGEVPRLREVGLRLAFNILGYQHSQGRLWEYREWLERLLADRADSISPETRVRGLRYLAETLRSMGDRPEARRHLLESLETIRQEGLTQGELESQCLLGEIACGMGDLTEAQERLQRAQRLAKEAQSSPWLSRAVYGMGSVALLQGERKHARRRFHESLQLAADQGDDRQCAMCLDSLGVNAWGEGNHGAARDYYEQGLEIARRLGDRALTCHVLKNLGAIATEQGELDAAEELLTESLSMSEEMDARRSEAGALINLFAVAHRRGDMEKARALLRRSTDLSREVGTPGDILGCLAEGAFLAVKCSLDAYGTRLLGAIMGLRECHGLGPMPGPSEDRIAEATEAALAALGQKAFDEAFAEGRAMSLEEAIEYALECLDGDDT